MADSTTYGTDEIFEIWEGEKIMMSPSSPRHESVLVNLIFFIKAYVSEHRVGVLYLSNTAIHLEGHSESKDFLMPDLSFVSNQNKHIVKEN